MARLTETIARIKAEGVPSCDYFQQIQASRKERQRQYDKARPRRQHDKLAHDFREFMYRKTHPDEWRARNAAHHNRRRDRKNAGGAFTPQEWRDLISQYHATCPCCGKSEPEITLTVDHVIPLSRGGGNTIDNIQPLCMPCNIAKFTKTIDYRSRIS